MYIYNYRTINGFYNFNYMTSKIDEALYFDNESNVKSQMVKSNIIRYILFVIIVMLISKFINPYMGLAIYHIRILWNKNRCLYHNIFEKIY